MGAERIWVWGLVPRIAPSSVISNLSISGVASMELTGDWEGDSTLSSRPGEWAPLAYSFSKHLWCTHTCPSAPGAGDPPFKHNSSPAPEMLTV